MEMELVDDEKFPAIVKQYENSFTSTKDVFESTVKVLNEIVQYGQEKGSLLRLNVPPHQVDHWYTRLAVGLTRFAASPIATLTEAQLYDLAALKPTITYTFSASGFRGTSHLVSACSKSVDRGSYEYDQENLLLMMSMLSLDDVPAPVLEAAADLAPQTYFILSMGWLTDRTVITEAGEKNREYLIKTSDRYSEIDIPPAAWACLSKVWMYCTYAETPDKHKIKFHLNKIIQRYLVTQGVTPRPIKYSKKDRPTVLVIHEFFYPNHAMYRCFAPKLRALKKDFNLIALADEKVIDKNDRDIFGYIKAAGYDSMPIQNLVEIINKIKPDIIYYPSIGMRWWVVMLANLRLAPIQIGGLGHPATTRSDVIDYVYTGYHEGNLDELYSEKILTTPHVFEADPHPLQAEVLEKISIAEGKKKDGKINIAINSKVMKLSYRLLAICNRLIDSTDNEVLFHFFPGEVGINDDGIRAAIHRIIPTAIVYSASSYIEFMMNLNKCDISLAAFPFGNTNSTVDACLLKMPVVAHFGPEIPAQSDKLVMSKANYPSWMISDNDEDYYRTAKRLVDEYFSGYDIKEYLIDSATADEIQGGDMYRHHYLRDFLVYVKNNHDVLLNSEDRVFTWEEGLDQRLELSAKPVSD
ncbi:hypothetical protein N9J28_00605 [bacterium]|nr:hypothetical protein [bacterium]